MKNHNKSDKPYGKQGKTEFKFGRYYSFQIVNDPLAFATSDRFNKISRRNKKRNKK